MRSHFTGRIPLPVGVVLALAVIVFGLLAALGLRSLVTGTASASPAAPNPGHEWSQVEGHGIDGSTYWLGTMADQALELRVNGTRALRLQPDPSPSIVGGWSANSVTPGVYGGTVAGGGDSWGANGVTDQYGTVGGGVGNLAGNDAGTTNDAWSATVAGGQENAASAPLSAVGGGEDNVASAWAATVSGGIGNQASAQYATVPGGGGNQAQGDYSFAAGDRAKANHIGSFVWADTGDFDFASTAANEFSARTTGGARFVSGIDGTGAPTAGVTLAAGGNAWAAISDRSVKANFSTVDGQDILGRLASVPIETWNLKSQDDSIRHMGPMAQDFYAAFGLGEDDKHITTVDADGVALAAVQGLYELSQEQSARIQTLEEESNTLRDRFDGLEARVSALEDGAPPAVAAAASSSGVPAMWLLLGGGLALAAVGLVLAGRRLVGGRP